MDTDLDAGHVDVAFHGAELEKAVLKNSAEIIFSRH